jgi:hypothetical protein
MMQDGPLVVTFVTAFVVGLLAAIVSFRHKRAVLRHEERMAVIEKGGVLPALDDDRPKAPWTPRVYLLRGMIWTFVGIATTVMLATFSLGMAHPVPLAWRLSEAQSLRTQGATEEQIRQFLNEEAKRNDGPPAGLATVGLLPIGVGIAYLLFYRKEMQNPLSTTERGADRLETV